MKFVAINIVVFLPFLQNSIISGERNQACLEFLDGIIGCSTVCALESLRRLESF